MPFDQPPGVLLPEAVFCAPGALIPRALAEHLGPSDTEELDWELDRSRVVCWTGIDERAISGVLRHELEHAAQRQQGGGTTALQLASILQVRLSDGGYEELPWHEQIDNLSPHERRERSIVPVHPTPDRRPGSRPSRKRPRPGPRSPSDGVLAPSREATLPARLICHAAVRPAAAETRIRQLGTLGSWGTRFREHDNNSGRPVRRPHNRECFPSARDVSLGN